MCGVSRRMEAKRPLEEAPPPATAPATASKLAKESKGVPAVGLGTSPPKSKNDLMVPAVRPIGVRPMGMVLEIVGTAREDRGRNCDDHTCCGLEVIGEDVVVRLRREQILVPNKLGKGEREETAYTVNWVTDGHDSCRVGFLPRAYVAQGGIFDGVLCQVVSVGNESDNDKNERAKVRRSCGYARVQVISPLNPG